MPKPELEFKHLTDFAWDRKEGFAQQILAYDEETGDTTKVVSRDPGHEQHGPPQIHTDFWEEVYILSGSIYDKGLKQWFRAGSYCCRPPGMIHGPYISCPNEGVKMFVNVRYVRKTDAPDNS
ncbi:hypothetical protein B9479_000205 [Cryptococcus floricola]|uniref:ChrR-like cupin domain-containing protein n=1 Tax=Cryptococcus floricola TaxID=2591691 RepID=A0A5D3BA12_9TREE|nr:hypothetical protein B9479_000205 [Cryptococcus floricola]